MSRITSLLLLLLLATNAGAAPAATPGLTAGPTTAANSRGRQTSLGSDAGNLVVLADDADGSILAFSDYSNWLIPGQLMVGRFPGMEGAASARPGAALTPIAAWERAYELVANATVSTFVSLQAETPPPGVDAAGAANTGPNGNGTPTANGAVAGSGWAAGFPEQLGPSWPPQLAPVQFPRDYAWDARAAASDAGRPEPTFDHFPIVDLTAPSLERLAHIATAVAAKIPGGGGSDDGAVYLHCWGGQGRAGIVGAAVLGLVRPMLPVDDALNLLQAGFETRTSSSAGTSPETDAQFALVRRFYAARDAGRIGIAAAAGEAAAVAAAVPLTLAGALAAASADPAHEAEAPHVATESVSIRERVR